MAVRNCDLGFLKMYSPYSISDLKRICAQYRIRPSKSRGQNFLIDERIAIAAAAHDGGGRVIEVGPGLGALTFKLAARAAEVIALEIDAKIAAALRAELTARGIAHVTLIETDAMQWFRQYAIAKFHHADNSIVANLPYAITSDFFSCILQDALLPRALTVMVQQEVAERLAARPPHMSLLSVVAQWYGAVRIVQRVPRSAFWPQPGVESALVHIDTADAGARARRAQIESAAFLSFVRRAFAFPRRKVKSSVPSHARDALARLQEFLERRPADLTADDWLALYLACRDAEVRKTLYAHTPYAL